MAEETSTKIHAINVGCSVGLSPYFGINSREWTITARKSDRRSSVGSADTNKYVGFRSSLRFADQAFRFGAKFENQGNEYDAAAEECRRYADLYKRSE